MLVYYASILTVMVGCPADSSDGPLLNPESGCRRPPPEGTVAGDDTAVAAGGSSPGRQTDVKFVQN